MALPVLLIGNDINNVTNNRSWEELLLEITTFLNVKDEISNMKTKPFPLLYEEIFLRALAKGRNPEGPLKREIAKLVSEIKPNFIHKRIMSLDLPNILTTNYEYSLQQASKSTPKAFSNIGHIDESTYSVFRHNKTSKSNIWHIHGECNYPKTITLGFEHYGGMLQQIRNYVVTGTRYKSKEKNLDGLIQRLRSNNLQFHSWIDFFFTDDIHILGLSLDTSEIDLWWLLTYRARQKAQYKKFDNQIFYYYPGNLHDTIKNKLQLLEANGVTPIRINGKDKAGYYTSILNIIVKVIDGKIKRPSGKKI